MDTQESMWMLCHSVTYHALSRVGFIEEDVWGEFALRR
jgi:hypothetical protein